MRVQKPLALYLFRQSHELYCQPPDKNLSPSFWESEDRSPSQWKGFDAVLPGIEHELWIEHELYCAPHSCATPEWQQGSPLLSWTATG